MKKGVWLILVAVILVIASALPSQADWRGGHGGSHFRGGIWIGPGWWGPPYYPYYYPYYAEPPVIIERQAPVYVQPNQQQEQDYWYYCTKPQGYYPYIKKCTGGWLKVVPSAPSDSETRNDTKSSQHNRPAKNTPQSDSKGERDQT